MNAEPDRELMVFSVARRLAAGQRAVFLEEACAGDAGLRQRVEELLQAGEDAGDFLEDSAQGVAAFTLGANLPGSGAAAEFASAPAEKSGDRIGRYKLLEQIGEGGCGVVYMAEQESPVRRKVALKVINLGMDIFLVSCAITSRSAPTAAARSVLLMTNRLVCVMPGPPLRGILSPPATSMAWMV